jgi:NDP-sugar pyrophosphorylase family protein
MTALSMETPGRRAAPAQKPDSVAGIILAGTHHWSGSSFEELRPRPLLPVAQTPLIDYVLEWLRDGGVSNATICANGSTAALREYLQDGERLAIDIGYQEDATPRGAAGCVKDAAAGSTAQTFVVADGTSIPIVDLQALIHHHRRSGAELTIVAHRRGTTPAGEPQLQPAGIYVFEREVLDAVGATSFQDIKESLIPRLYKEGRRIELFAVDELSPKVLNADTYLAINYWMIARLGAGNRAPAATDGRSAEIVAHPSAWIDPSAMIIGPVILGPSVRVHAGATIVGPTSIGAATSIGRGAVVARSIIWNNCEIGERSEVDSCLIADEAEVAPATKLFGAIRLKQTARRALLGHLFAGRKPQPRAAEALARPALS